MTCLFGYCGLNMGLGVLLLLALVCFFAYFAVLANLDGFNGVGTISAMIALVFFVAGYIAPQDVLLLELGATLDWLISYYVIWTVIVTGAILYMRALAIKNHKKEQ